MDSNARGTIVQGETKEYSDTKVDQMYLVISNGSIYSYSSEMLEAKLPAKSSNG